MIWLGPEPRSPLARLENDPRVTISAHGTWLDAEPESDQ